MRVWVCCVNDPAVMKMSRDHPVMVQKEVELFHMLESEFRAEYTHASADLELITICRLLCLSHLNLAIVLKLPR